MKRKNPKKGPPFERKMAKKLSLWLTNGERDDCIWRTAQSGGRATQRAKDGKKTAGSYGDLCSTHELTKQFFDNFAVELKKGYSNTNPLDFVDSNKREPELLSFWNQCEKSRKDGNKKHSILIVERNRRKPIIIINSILLVNLDFFYGQFKRKFINLNMKNLNLYIISLNDFFKWIPTWDDGFFK